MSIYRAKELNAMKGPSSEDVLKQYVYVMYVPYLLERMKTHKILA